MTAYAKRMKSNWIVDSCSDGPSDFIQSVFQMLPQEGLQVCVCECECECLCVWVGGVGWGWGGADGKPHFRINTSVCELKHLRARCRT